MATLGAATVAALEPWVGRIVAEASVRASAASLDTTVDGLSAAHLTQLERSIRHVLAPVAPPGAIEQVITQMRASETGD